MIQSFLREEFESNIKNSIDIISSELVLFLRTNSCDDFDKLLNELIKELFLN